ncbi:MAG: MATE family Na+-driven efflux transporter, partial [Acholeplasmataceae bacterium]
MIDSIRRSMRRLNYRLLMSLILLGLIPTIYTTVRVFLIGQLPDDWGFNIASQLAWVHLLYEVLQEAIILPLFYFIGKAIYDRIDLTNKVRTGLIFTGTIYVALSMLIIVFAEPIIRFMAQEVELIDATATYVRLETVAEIFSMLVRFLLVVIVVIDKDRYIYYVLGLRMVLTIVLDVFLVSTLSFSLSLGVNGIAITNIIVNILMLVLAYGILKREHVFLFAKQKLSFGWIKELSRVGGISGLESLIRNLAFMLMIVRMVNVVGEQGTFWVANNFIWGWLLLPVLQLGELIKRDCGEDENAIKEKSLGYFAVTAIIVLLWALTLPLWIPFFRDVLRLDHYQ